jgi:hypothetical protein
MRILDRYKYMIAAPMGAAIFGGYNRWISKNVIARRL